MKKIIVILGTILLAVFILSTIIMGDTNSFKTNATTIQTKSTTAITGL